MARPLREAKDLRQGRHACEEEEDARGEGWGEREREEAEGEGGGGRPAEGRAESAEETREKGEDGEWEVKEEASHASTRAVMGWGDGAGGVGLHGGSASTHDSIVLPAELREVCV